MASVGADLAMARAGYGNAKRPEQTPARPRRGSPGGSGQACFRSTCGGSIDPGDFTVTPRSAPSAVAVP
jgi:hypothetical protein